MDFKELKRNILDNKIPKNVILSGDIEVINIYLEKIKNIKPIKTLNTINNYIDILQSKTFLNDENVVYLIKDDDTYKNNNTFWDIQRDNLILVYTNLKKNEKFFKAFEKDIVYFNNLTKEDLQGAIAFKLNIDINSINWLIENNNTNYSKIMNEVDKIALFNREEHQKIFNEFKQNNILNNNFLLEPFSFSNAISDRNVRLAIDVIDRTSKYELMKHLVGAYNTLRNQLLVQNHISKSNDIETKANELNMSKGMYYVLNKKRNIYTTEELCQNLLILSEYINKVKLGLIDVLDAIYLFVLRCI